MKDLVDLFKSSNYDSGTATQMIQCICDGRSSILDAVECLGELLTSENSGERAAGTRLLAEVLHGLPKNCLNEAQIKFISAFFLERMKDHHTVIPAVLYALPCLLELEQISNSDVEKLVRGLLLEVHCQSQLMLDRRNFYSVIRIVITKHKAVIDGMFNEFVLGFISAADGEKDPRNLLLLFSLVPVIANAGTLGKMSEDLFEVVAAYFPIDFVPPVHDPLGVTEEDLSDGLRQCLSCHVGWAEYFLPLLCEKMESDLPQAKKEAYRTLILCCTRGYTSEALSPHLTVLWHCIRRDVVDGSDAQVSAVAIEALSAVLAAAHIKVVDVNAVTTIVDTIIDECVVHLPAPESRLFLPASDLLTAVIAAQECAALRVYPKAVSHLTEVTKTPDSSSRAWVNVLNALAKMASASRQRDQCYDVVPTEVEAHCNACLGAVTAALQHHSAAVVAEGITAARALFYCRSAASPWWGQLRQEILNVLLSSGGSDTHVRSNALSALAEPSDGSCELLTLELLPHLNIGAVADAVLDAVVVLTDAASCQRCVEALWKAIEAHPTPALCKSLAKIIDKTGDDPGVQEFLFSSWRGLDKVVALGVMAALPSAALDKNHTSNLPDFLQQLSEEEKLDLLSAIAELCRSLSAIRGPRAAHSAELAAELLSGSSPTSGWWHDVAENFNVAAVWPLGTETAAEKTALLVVVVEGLVCWCQDPGPLGRPELLLPLLRWATAPAAPEACRQAAVLAIATLVNKLPTSADFSCLLEWLEHELKKIIEGGHAPHKKLAVTLMGWMLKALEMRAAPEALKWRNELQLLLSNEELGVTAAQCYSVLLSDHAYAFCASSSSSVRLLYKQRTFEGLVTSLVSEFDVSSGKTRRCCLLAIASLLPHVPQPLLQHHIDKLLVVLVEGVRSTAESAVVSGSVSTLRLLLQAQPLPSQLASHAGSLVLALLALTNSPHATKNKGAKCFLRNKVLNHQTFSTKSENSEISSSTDVVVDDVETFKTLVQLSESPHEAATGFSLTDTLDQKCSVEDKVTSSVPQLQPLLVREASLACLELLTRLPLADVLPYRAQVVRELKCAVSDHKRVVRRAAAAARTAWLQLGTGPS